MRISGGNGGSMGVRRTKWRADVGIFTESIQRTAQRAVSIEVHPAAGKRVLLIDDNPVLGRIYSCALMAAGCVVELAGDAAVGFERVLAEPYDVVVSDIVAPASAGLELLKKVRRWRPGVPFVLILAELDEETLALSRQMGMLRYLVKPMSMDHLARAVESAAMVGAARTRSGDRRDATR